ncbi:MAG: hypothetical protein L0J31_04410, partial [Corynebacterium sp.]|nr:hypothetical protein [Corynebacterium sp.]
MKFSLRSGRRYSNHGLMIFCITLRDLQLRYRSPVRIQRKGATMPKTRDSLTLTQLRYFRRGAEL